MSTWRIIVNWFLPPPLVLTLLLISPMPPVIKKGLLKFTRRFLFYPTDHWPQLVHIVLLTTGMMWAASAVTTYQLINAPLSDTLTPNQRTAVLARRWREERNFWIATLVFLLWGLLYRFYQLMTQHMELRDRVRQLEGGSSGSGNITGTGAAAKHSSRWGLGGGKGSSAAAPPVGGGKAGVEPSAPPAPLEPSVANTDEPKKVK